MLIRIFKGRVPVIILLASMVSLAMCKKDDDDPGANYRISKINSYYGDYLTQGSDYKYSDDKITLIENEYPAFAGYPAYNNKTEVNYPQDDSVVIINYYLNNGDWDPESMTFLELENGLTVRASFAWGGTDIIRMAYEYQYNDSNLTERVMYLYGDLFEKTTYEYDGTDLIKSLIYSYTDGWILSRLDTLFYNGDDIDSLVGFEYVDGVRNNYRKHVYLHENGLITQVDDYEGDTTSWRHIENYIYTYDSHKNLASKSWESGGEILKDVYYFEKGTGNYKKVMTLPGSDYLDFTILPGPLKSTPNATQQF